MGKRSSAEQRLTGLGIEKRRIVGISGHVKEDPYHQERTRSRIAHFYPPPVSLSANDDWLPEINVLPFFVFWGGGWAVALAGGVGEWGIWKTHPWGGVDIVTESV